MSTHLLTTRLLAPLAVLLLGAGSPDNGQVTVSGDASSPVHIVGWASCDLRAGGWEVTWAAVNLHAQEATTIGFSTDLTGLRDGDVIPAYSSITGRQIAPRTADRATLDVTYTWPATNPDNAAELATATIELGQCRHTPGRPPAKTDPDHATNAGAHVRAYAGCDTLAIVAAGPTDGTGTTYTLRPGDGESVHLEAAPSELSDVAALPAQSGLTVDVTAADGGLLDTVIWNRPANCPRQISWRTTLTAVGITALALLAIGAALLARRHRPGRTAPPAT